MKIPFVILFFLFSLFSHGQKTVTTTIDATGLNSIVISGDEIYRISVTTAPVDVITISTNSEGEYYNQINLEPNIAGETLFLTSRFREILQSGYDKLSAHKVFAMEVTLEIPEMLSLDIVSNLSSVTASGDYKKAVIQLKSGSCSLAAFSGDAVVNTFNGNITVETTDADITATSRHGEVDVTTSKVGLHEIVLSSINGNIRVVKTK